LGGQNAAIWLAQKISIFWWDFPSDSKLTTANIWPVTETRFRKHARQIWLGGLVGERLAEKPSHHSGLNIAKSFNDLVFRTWWTLRVVNFESDEKSDRSIDIFSTNQNAPFWRIFNKIDTPTYLLMKNQTKNLMDLWCIDISNFKLVTDWGSGAYQRIV
jgi:hypothetical protein